MTESPVGSRCVGQTTALRGDNHAFSTHTTDTTDAAHLSCLGGLSRHPSLRPRYASDCGHTHFRAAAARLFGPSCGQPDRRNLVTRKETGPQEARPGAAKKTLASGYCFASHLFASAFHTPPA